MGINSHFSSQKIQSTPGASTCSEVSKKYYLQKSVSSSSHHRLAKTPFSRLARMSEQSEQPDPGQIAEVQQHLEAVLNLLFNTFDRFLEIVPGLNPRFSGKIQHKIKFSNSPLFFHIHYNHCFLLDPIIRQIVARNLRIILRRPHFLFDGRVIQLVGLYEQQMYPGPRYRHK